MTMSGKDKSSTTKDIDDVLSSIDSLLDTATDVETDDLPVLDLESDSETERAQEKQSEPKLSVPKKTAVIKKKTTSKKPAKANNNTNKKKIVTKDSAPAKKVEMDKKQPKKANNSSAKELSAELDSRLETSKGQSKPQLDNQSESDTNSSTTRTDFSFTKQELPILDEIITEEEMVLIAAGKELPKRVITEKFAPKTTTDKIIELLTIHLSDYKITRLEYEYLHELIDELLEEEKNKPK